MHRELKKLFQEIVNIYAGLRSFAEAVRNYQWTEWRDVPVVQKYSSGEI